MDMITPWDSLEMGGKLHVATDLEAILSVSLLGILPGGLTADQNSTWGDSHPKHIDIADDLFHGLDNTLGQSWDG